MADDLQSDVFTEAVRIDVPVQVPKRQQQGARPEQNVVIAIDSSDASVEAINWYLEKLHRTGNRLVFVHAVELSDSKVNQEKEEAKLKRLEEKMKTILKEKQIKGVLRTATGKPGQIICRISEEENAVMIVVGTRSLGSVRKAVLGSVGDFLVKQAICPVVVCKKKDRKQSVSGEKNPQKFSRESIRRLFSVRKQSSRTESVEVPTEILMEEIPENSSTDVNC